MEAAGIEPAPLGAKCAGDSGGGFRESRLSRGKRVDSRAITRPSRAAPDSLRRLQMPTLSITLREIDPQPVLFIRRRIARAEIP